MGMSVITGVVYGFKMSLNKELLTEVKSAGFVAYPVAYSAEDIDPDNQEYIFGISVAKMTDAAQVVQLPNSFNALQTEYKENAQHLSFIVKGVPSVLMTSYYLI